MSSSAGIMCVQVLQEITKKYDPVELAANKVRCQLLMTWLLCVARTRKSGTRTHASSRLAPMIALPGAAKVTIDAFLGGWSSLAPPLVPAAALKMITASWRKTQRAKLDCYLSDYLSTVSVPLMEAAKTGKYHYEFLVPRAIQEHVDAIDSDVREQQNFFTIAKKEFLAMGYNVGGIHCTCGAPNDTHHNIFPCSGCQVRYVLRWS